MTITIGGLTIPIRGTMEWIDRFDWSPVAMESARTLGGTQVLWTQSQSKGQNITLEAGEAVGWFSLADIKLIQAMAAQPGATFSFDYHGEGHTVAFRHNDPPAISFQPLWPGYDLHTGTIKLVTV